MNSNLSCFSEDSTTEAESHSSIIRRRHFTAVGISVLFSSLMMAFDIGSDIATGLDFLYNGDPGWATFTFIVICLPWLARALISFTNLRMCFTLMPSSIEFSAGRYFVWKNEMIDSLLEFPLIQPFRLVKTH